MDTDFIYNGVYSESESIFITFHNWFLTLLYLPSLIPGLIGSITLDNGGDTSHGYEDMYLVSKTITSFAVTFWSILGVWTYEKILQLKSKKIKNASSQSNRWLTIR